MHKGYLAVILLALLGIALAAILTDRGLAVFTDQAPVTANTFTTGTFPTPTINSFGAVADTYVKEDKGGDDNFGTDTDMQVKSDTSKVKRALVAFDVSSIPAGSTVSSATLTLCLSVDPPVAAQGRTHELRLVTSSWTETVVVWNAPPTVSAAVTDTTPVPTTAQCLIFSVTASAQRWVAGVANNRWCIGA